MFTTSQPSEFESMRIKAERGDAEAEFDMGRCYQNGWVVRQDRAEALKWYEKSAEKGNPRAQVLAGMSYWQGLDVKVDKAKGLKWIEEAAEQGDPGAFACLCSAYYKGDGVVQDYVQSYKWGMLFMESRQSDIISEDERTQMKVVMASLEQKLTTEQISEVRRLAKEEKARIFKQP